MDQGGTALVAQILQPTTTATTTVEIKFLVDIAC